MFETFDPGALDAVKLARAFRRARPFPHVVLDGLLSADDLAALAAALLHEPMQEQEDEHFHYRGGMCPPLDETVRAFADKFTGPAMRALVGTLAEQTMVRADARAFRYEAGDFLLPHADTRPDDPRAVAFAWYVSATRPLRGGELELFACETDGARLTATRAAKKIAPKDNRLVVFGVSPLALHQVREVLRGTRFSLAGWFYT